MVHGIYLFSASKFRRKKLHQNLEEKKLHQNSKEKKLHQNSKEKKLHKNSAVSKDKAPTFLDKVVSKVNQTSW